MSKTATGGVLTISIDLELDLDEQTRSDGRALDAVTRRLADLLDRYQMGATWGVADPALSAATEVILGRQARHELALLGDPTWVGRSAGRTRFARELARRTATARAAGLPATSLLLRKVQLDEHLDLLMKHGITAVRPSVTRERLAPSAQLEPLCYGVWQAPATCRLPGESGWLGFRSSHARACRTISRAIDKQAIVHLACDGPKLASGGSQFSAVERTLEFAAEKRQAGVLTVELLGTLAARLKHRPEGVPARSALRGAA